MIGRYLGKSSQSLNMKQIVLSLSVPFGETYTALKSDRIMKLGEKGRKGNLKHVEQMWMQEHAYFINHAIKQAFAHFDGDRDGFIGIQDLVPGDYNEQAGQNTDVQESGCEGVREHMVNQILRTKRTTINCEKFKQILERLSSNGYDNEQKTDLDGNETSLMTLIEDEEGENSPNEPPNVNIQNKISNTEAQLFKI